MIGMEEVDGVILAVDVDIQRGKGLSPPASEPHPSPWT